MAEDVVIADDFVSEGFLWGVGVVEAAETGIVFAGLLNGGWNGNLNRGFGGAVIVAGRGVEAWRPG